MKTQLFKGPLSVHSYTTRFKQLTETLWIQSNNDLESVESQIAVLVQIRLSYGLSDAMLL